MSLGSYHLETRGGGRARRYRAVVYVGKREGGPRRLTGPWRRLEREAKTDGAGLLERAALASAPHLTVAQLLDRYLAARPRLRPTTRQRYEHDRRRVVADKGDRPAAAMLPVEWEEYFASLQPALAPKSVANLRGLVHAAYRWAVRGRLLTYNAVADTETPPLTRAKPPAPTADRVLAALAAVHGHRLEGAAILMAAGGLRIGEALARQWRDVTEGTVRIDSQVTQTRDASLPMGQRTVLHIGPPKSARGQRTVPLPAPAAAMLADLKRRRQAACIAAGETWSDERLVSARSDGSLIPPHQASSELGLLWRRAGLSEMHPHLLRHAFVTELVVRRGVDAQTAADLAGHSTPATTLAYYTHADGRSLQAASEALARAWEEAALSLSPPRRHQLDTRDSSVVSLATARKRKTPA